MDEMLESIFRQKTLEEFVKLLGFDSLNQYNKLVFTTDVSTPEKLAALEKWQAEDGTKAGLLRLREESSAKSGTGQESQAGPPPKTATQEAGKVKEAIPQKEIVLIDDKPYGLQQIKNAIPDSKKGDYRLLHFSSFADYQSQIKHRAWLVLLDFFLDLDQRYGSQVASQIEADIIIGFSSNSWGSEAIIEAVEQQQQEGTRPQLFAIEKLKGVDHNEALAELFSRLL
jgi:hypothetical protein